MHTGIILWQGCHVNCEWEFDLESRQELEIKLVVTGM